MTAGDILDQAIRLYRQNFVPLITIVAIVTLPVVIVQAISSALVFPITSNGVVSPPNLANTSASVAFFLVSFLVSLVGGILSLFEIGALVSFISERFLGREITVRQAYGNAFRRWLSLLIAVILVGLVVIGLFVILIALATLPIIASSALLSSSARGPAGVLAGLGTLLLCILFIPVTLGAVFMAMRWAFWLQAIVIENYNSTGGLGRSWKLTKGSFWRILGFNLLLGILVSVLSFSLLGATSVGLIFVGNPLFQLVAQSIMSGLIGIIVYPLQFATLTVLYYDIRIRKEGLDLQLQMQDGTASPVSLMPPPTPPSSMPPPNTLAPSTTQPNATPTAPTTNQEPPLDLPPLFSRDDYAPK